MAYFDRGPRRTPVCRGESRRHRQILVSARSIGDRAGSLPAELSIDWKTRLEEMEMTYYTGIDVSLRSVSICVVDDKGEVCLEAKWRPRSMPSSIVCTGSAAT